jgi:hypothetical protein
MVFKNWWEWLPVYAPLSNRGTLCHWTRSTIFETASSVVSQEYVKKVCGTVDWLLLAHPEEMMKFRLNGSKLAVKCQKTAGSYVIRIPLIFVRLWNTASTHSTR